MSGPRKVQAPRGNTLTCKAWLTEAPYRMIQNNLDPEVAQRPDDLVVYGGRGQAARNWDCFDAILDSLKNMEDDATLLVQGTYETLASLAAQHGWESLKGKFVLTAGLGGMGAAQPLAITMNEGVGLGGQ